MSQAARSSRRSWSSSSPTSRWGCCGGAGEPRRARPWDTPSSTRSWPPCPIGWSRRSERAEPAAYRGQAPGRVLIPIEELVVCWMKQRLLAWPSGGQTAKPRSCRVYRLVFSRFEKICVFWKDLLASFIKCLELKIHSTHLGLYQVSSKGVKRVL